LNLDVRQDGAFAWALVGLEPGEEFVSEAGAMFRRDAHVEVDVTVRHRGGGGILGGLRRGLGRLLSGESFFLSTYRTQRPGEVALAPTLAGSVRLLELGGEDGSEWYCAGGSFLGASGDLDLDVSWQGLKGFLSGESIVFVRARGDGPLLVHAFGRMVELEVDGELVVDTGHLVAYERGLEWSISKAGGSWFQSFLGGEGLVMKFRGRGRLLVQSHAPRGFGMALGRLLPPRKQ
jgi:uncharacterized protein (TIGR00266 family)